MIKRLMATFAFAAVVSTPVSAAILYATGGVQTTIPGLTGFQTTGAMMDGMQITACFVGNPICETRAWADGGGADSGGVTGTGWALSLTGDSFFQTWEFDFTDSPGQLESLLLDGRGALTIFDRTFLGAAGTPGSAFGRDWTSALGAIPGTTINVTFLDPTRIEGGPALAVGDIFQQVFVEFGATGPTADFTFSQDTDNDSRFDDVPEPSTLLLLGLGMLALAGVRRRRV